MPLYRFHDLIIESNVAFSEIYSVDGEVPTCVFQLLSADARPRVSPRWTFHWRFPNGKPWLSFGALDPGYLLRFSDYADFFVTTCGKKIRCCPGPDTSFDVVEHLFLNQVVPRVLNHSGTVVLHASAVVSPVGAVAFLGETGWGKSTLAASFSAERLPLLSDDGIVIKEDSGKLCAIPSQSGLRLWPDSLREIFQEEPRDTEASRKTSVGCNRVRLAPGETPVPIRGIYVLSPSTGLADPDKISVDPLSSREAFLELVKHLYRLHDTDRQRLKKEFSELGRIADAISFSRLRFPHRYSRLPLVRKTVLNHVSEAH